MTYLHYQLDLEPDEVVEVTLDKQANVRLLDEANFSSYRRGQRHIYHGGASPDAPRSGLLLPARPVASRY